jgi:hypothetical protein
MCLLSEMLLRQILLKAATMSEDYQDIERENTYQSRKTRSITFRLDSKVIDELQTEAHNFCAL